MGAGGLIAEDGSCICCGGDDHKIIVVTEVKNQDWAKAVTDHNLVGVQFLHHPDPDLITQPVDTTNGMAIHYAVTTIPGSKPLRDESMLKYLLENGAEVNAQGGEGYNSALHYAVIEIVKMHEANEIPGKIEPLWECVRLLYCHGINEKLKNNDHHTAVEIITGVGNKTLLKTWNKKKNAGEEFYANRHGIPGGGAPSPRKFNFPTRHTKQSSALLLAGMDMNDTTNDALIKRYVKETDDATKTMKKKAEAISKRTNPLTHFGEDTGIDPDEIAVEMQKIPDLGKVWHKCTKGHDTMVVYKQTEMYKILYSLTLMAARKKNPSAKKPPQTAVKKLTIKLSKKFPKEQGRVVLKKEFFVSEFYRLLYNVHDEMHMQYKLDKGMITADSPK